MSAHTIQLDPNIYKQRAALIEARRIMRLPEQQAQQAIAHLILGHVIQDVNRVAFNAHLAAMNVGGKN